MLDEGGGNGTINRIVKFGTTAGKAVAQYAYEMRRSGQGQAISTLIRWPHSATSPRRSARPGLMRDPPRSPAAQSVFDTVDRSLRDWGLALAVAATVLLLDEARKYLRKRFRAHDSGR